MEAEFILYEQALDLKELGFDEPCFGCYVLETNGDYKLYNKCEVKTYFTYIEAPLYQQVFRWFREKYNLYHSIGLDNSLENDVNCDYQIINHSQSISELETNFKSYEEAELECLKKLIEIVKNK